AAAPRGGHLPGPAIRGLPAALAARPSGHAPGHPRGIGGRAGATAGIAAVGGGLGTDGAAGARPWLSAALAGGVDRRGPRAVGGSGTKRLRRGCVTLNPPRNALSDGGSPAARAAAAGGAGQPGAGQPALPGSVVPAGPGLGPGAAAQQRASGPVGA